VRRGNRYIITSFTAYWLAAQCSRRLPLQFVYWLGFRVADRVHARDRAGRAHVAANLRRIYAYRRVRVSDAFIARRTRKTYQYFGKYLVDFFRYSTASRDEIERRVTVAGLDRLEDALARGRGAILLSAHLGNWELGGLTLALLGHPVTTVYRPFGNPRIDRLFEARRNARGFTAIPIGSAARELAGTLRRGGAVALLGDRDFSAHVHPVPFFGQPASLPRGPAVLAARTRAPIVPAFLVRGVDDHYLLEFEPPIDPAGNGDVEHLQARIVEALERTIGAHPHQWFIFDDFWGGAAPADGRSATP